MPQTVGRGHVIHSSSHCATPSPCSSCWVDTNQHLTNPTPWNPQSFCYQQGSHHLKWVYWIPKKNIWITWWTLRTDFKVRPTRLTSFPEFGYWHWSRLTTFSSSSSSTPAILLLTDKLSNLDLLYRNEEEQPKIIAIRLTVWPCFIKNSIWSRVIWMAGLPRVPAIENNIYLLCWHSAPKGNQQ